MNDFGIEYIKDLVITQRKTHSKVSLLPKERFPDKKGFSSRKLRSFDMDAFLAMKTLYKEHPFMDVER
ncbi:hypothetical protein pdam_00017563 [Pocillopora damicornis]|uniref:Uncharacterized protein n=1 Tax=Pocillopora damicornis TaxID=46731 RepID=A0A3M6TRD3_POCDA|nr:hypothetical protein pdam_00017563 [Pocillopora damicornis]